MDHLRLTWQPSDWPNPSTLQIRVIPKGKEKTTFGFHHEKLSDAFVREQIRSHWKKVLEIVETRLEQPEATLQRFDLFRLLDYSLEYGIRCC